MRLGAKLLVRGPKALEISPVEAARAAEAAGFDSVWVDDHVVMPEAMAGGGSTAAYRSEPSERDNWNLDSPLLEPVATLAVLAAATTTLEIGTAVLILPIRHPIVLAKQLATIDALCGPRLALGVGLGWFAEEFVGLGVPYARRGRRFDEWIELMRACWQGSVGPWTGEHYSLDQRLGTAPTPASPPAILVGGMSPRAIDRAGRRGDGWLPVTRAATIDPAALTRGIDAMRTAAAEADRSVSRVVLRIGGDLSVAGEQLRQVIEGGVTELIIDVAWGEDGAAESAVRRAREVLLDGS